MKRTLLTALFLAAALNLGGCGSTSPKTEVVEIPGYNALQEQFQGRDLSPLTGRRIVLDPGHGGFFRGAVGPGGLTEAEVNLGAALYLRGLLEWAGAEVFMTRTADYDFLSPADSTLVHDLAFRVSFTDSLQPDVFLSLHHNSTASLDRTVNETQTYYPLGADGASLDLARAIHRHLVLNLEITPARILPGNFHVLRNATVPAVLGEPAMISHPVIEGRLSLAAGQRLEAEAYFLGLLDYFSAGAPYWAGARTDSVTFSGDLASNGIRWVFRPESPGSKAPSGPGPDPGTFVLTLDGAEVPFHLSEDGLGVTWYPPGGDLALPAVLGLAGRNLAGRATPFRQTVLLPPEPRRLKVRLMPEAGGDHTAIHWSTTGSAPVPPGQLELAAGRIIPLSGGTEGSLLVEDQGADFSDVIFRAQAPGSIPLPCDATTDTLPAPWNWHYLATSGPALEGPWSLRGEFPGHPPLGFTNQNGPLVPMEPGMSVRVLVPGFLPLLDMDPADPNAPRTVTAADPTWVLEPVVPGLRGRIIVLDPAGGGSDTDGTGPLGTRGATLNLETALLAKGLLEGCGAIVHLTRRGETALPDEAKVGLAGMVGADFFLTIGRSPQPHLWTAHHHAGSATGIRWAELFLQAVAGLGAASDSLAMTPSYDYLLRHTACPALEVRFPGPQTPAQELVLTQRGWLRGEARALLLSLASLFEDEGRLAPTLDVAAFIAELPGASDIGPVEWAELDGNFIWSPLPARSDLVSPAGLSREGADSLDLPLGPGLPALLDRHTLEIFSASGRQLWILERNGSSFSARLMTNNP